ncbi:MAG: hypothetical protein WC781_05010 [Candidatus Pacearchaeota archaeon]|jgi:hypothetical protein
MKLRINVKPAKRFQKVSREDLEALADSIRVAHLMNLSNPEGVEEDKIEQGIVFSEKLFPAITVYPRISHGHLKIDCELINPSLVYSILTEKGYIIQDSRMIPLHKEDFSNSYYSIKPKISEESQ